MRGATMRSLAVMLTLALVGACDPDPEQEIDSTTLAEGGKC